MDVSIHRATNVRLAHVFPTNGNSVCLEIQADGRTHTLMIYGLSVRDTDRFNVFRDADTSDFE